MSEPNPNDPTKPQAPSQGAASSAAVRPAAQPVSGMMAQSGIMVGSAGYPDMAAPQAGSPRPVAPQQVKARVTSVFLYVKSVEKSIEFYSEALGGAVTQKHADDPKGPLTLAIVRMGDFSLMLHIADETDADLKDNRWGVGIHLQMRVSSADFAYDRACDAGYHARVSDGPIDQEWGWREFAIKDPDGYIWSIYEDKSNGAWT
ncbi:MAG: VOC family protein [Isosphaeraceae bacterium]